MAKTPVQTKRGPGRPRVKYRPGYDRNGKIPAPPKKTPEQVAAVKIERLEIRHGISPNLVRMLILKQRGLLTNVCRALKISRFVLTKYIASHPECVEALEHARDAMGDVAESKLFEQIEAGDVRCILFYLSTVQRGRGYAVRPDDFSIDGSSRNSVHVETVNIVGVPSGTFLPKEPQVIDSP